MKFKVTNPHFKWGFNYSPSRALCWFRQRRGSQHHCYRQPPLEAILKSFPFQPVFLSLIANIFPNCRFVDIADSRNVISSCPKVTISPLWPVLWMPVKNHQAAFPLQVCHDIRNTQLRWYSQVHMDMIHANLAFNKVDLLHFAKFPKDFSYLHFHFSIHNLSPILRNEDYMVCAIPCRM